ncbi:hypothetical protein, partial [Chryseobacterium lactis]|uniref:hypothetical protein n=1 Tax=Chryseobacterium lactis TaxID=1241981 RepID=UPI001C89EED6
MTEKIYSFQIKEVFSPLSFSHSENIKFKGISSVSLIAQKYPDISDDIFIKSGSFEDLPFFRQLINIKYYYFPKYSLAY